MEDELIGWRLSAKMIQEMHRLEDPELNHILEQESPTIQDIEADIKEEERQRVLEERQLLAEEQEQLYEWEAYPAEGGLFLAQPFADEVQHHPAFVVEDVSDDEYLPSEEDE